jgi:hypothetical protein
MNVRAHREPHTDKASQIISPPHTVSSLSAGLARFLLFTRPAAS